jgi:hypothetical protein
MAAVHPEPWLRALITTKGLDWLHEGKRFLLNLLRINPQYAHRYAQHSFVHLDTVLLSTGIVLVWYAVSYHKPTTKRDMLPGRKWRNPLSDAC